MVSIAYYLTTDREQSHLPHLAFLFLDAAIHELGHLAFSLTGEFLGIAGGTIFQLAAPIISAVMFIRQPDYFAACFCGVWLSGGLWHVSCYIADARAQAGDTSLSQGLWERVYGQGVETHHDWNYLLSRMGLLEWDHTIGTIVWLIALVCMWSSIAAGAWMLWMMVKSSRERSQG